MVRFLFIIGIWLLCLIPSYANRLESISLIDGKIIDWQLDNASQIYTYGDISIKITHKQSDNDEKAAINYALRQFEYIKEADSEESTALDKFMAPLIGKNFGQNEKDCSNWPLVFSQYPNQRQGNTYKIVSGGLTCTFQKGQIIGNNLMVKSVCLDEDSPLTLANHILSYDGTI